MATAESFIATRPIKALYLGRPGTGKTGSLTSLVDRFKLKIWDFDNNLEVLIQRIQHEKKSLKNVDLQTFTDEFTLPAQPITSSGKDYNAVPFYKGFPSAYRRGLEAFNKWDDGTNPQEWGTDTIIVVDSLTSMGEAAFRFAWATDPMCKDKRNVYGNAQRLIMNTIYLLCSTNIKAHVLLLSHIEEDTDTLGILRGYPKSIGRAIRDEIAGWFNCVLLAEKDVTGKRQIKTNSGFVDLKNPVSFSVPETLPIETGMIQLFNSIRPEIK